LSYEDEIENLKKGLKEVKESIEGLGDIKTSVEGLNAFMTSVQATQKEECEAKGGRWNDEEKTCKLPEVKEGLFSAEALAWLSSDIAENLPFVVAEKDDKFVVLQGVNEVIEALKSREALKEILEQYAPAPNERPARYPREVLPIPTFLALMGKLCKTDEKVNECIARIKGGEREALPSTKEACEEKGGTWDPEKKTCKLPEEEGGESLQGLGILPSSTRSSTLTDEQRLERLVKNAKGEG